MDIPVTHAPGIDLAWPREGVTRVPFRVFSDPAIYDEEQQRIFRGRSGISSASRSRFRTPVTGETPTVGETPVLVTRDATARSTRWSIAARTRARWCA